MNFGESSIECSYIQNLLYNFYVPTIKINPSPSQRYRGQHYIQNGSLYTKKEDGSIISEGAYSPGKRYDGITRNHISESNNYNTNLHEALGNYLRFIRDYYGVDLMPLYNCFSNRFIDTFSLPIIEERRKDSVIKPGCRLFAFPVKFGNTYTLKCRGNTSATTQLAFFNGKKPLEITFQKTGGGEVWINFEASQISVSQFEESVYTVDSAYKYVPDEVNGQKLDSGDKDIYKQLLLDNEINLYLFVQVPNENASNIVVIENNSNSVINNSLLNNNLQQPYSDKLLGYLTNYYIYPLDSVQENIAAIQEILSSKYFEIKDQEGNAVTTQEGEKVAPIRLEGNYVKGTFDYITRSFIYDLFRFRGISDFTGYVDKDVESLIYQEGK